MSQILPYKLLASQLIRREGVEKRILYKNKTFPLQAQGKGRWDA